MAHKKRKKLVALIPNEAGIIRAERVPDSMDSCTIRDLREALFNSALYVEQCARDYIDDPPPAVDASYIDAMQCLIDKGEYLRSLVDDKEINKLPVSIAEKIWGLAISAMFIGRMEQLAQLAPILSKEQIIRELYTMTREKFAAAEKDRAEKHTEIAVKLETNRKAIEDRNRHEGERARITQKQAAEYILRAEKNANITSRSLKLDSIIRRVKAWDAYINSNGKKGTRPAAGYNRYQSPESFAQWARNILASDERYNKSNREH